MFFKALASTAIKGNIKCNLCTKWPETRRIKCEAHDYCNVCTEFVLKNDYKIFPQISKCEKCKNLIESLKISTKNEKNNYIKFNTVESQRFNSEVVNSQIIQSRNNRNSYQTVTNYKQGADYGLNMIQPVTYNIDNQIIQSRNNRNSYQTVTNYKQGADYGLNMIQPVTYNIDNQIKSFSNNKMRPKPCTNNGGQSEISSNIGNNKIDPQYRAQISGSTTNSRISNSSSHKNHTNNSRNDSSVASSLRSGENYNQSLKHQNSKNNPKVEPRKSQNF